MSLYQFVFKETAKGAADHDHHLNRRQDATKKGRAIGVFLQGDVCEHYIGGSWYYTWIVESANPNKVTGFLQECVSYGFVELSSGSTRVLTDEDLAEIKAFYDELKAAFPKG
jgi:hypothetical protein